jgi:hypothetical protein
MAALLGLDDKKSDIIIPIEDKSNLISTLKSMLLNNELDSYFIDLLVDIDKIRDYMDKFVISSDMYNEFDMLEDSLEKCIDEFPRYTCDELYNILINEYSYVYVDKIGLVKKK